MTEITTVKQRFGIIGTSPLLDRALDVALRVAPTDLTVLVTGESGVGKEFFPQVIHAFSARKHNKYIAVNCAAIPEGTIDSELFGHEKGAFTGAFEARKGYFEFIRVGSSKVQKTDVRVVAATNVDLPQAIVSGRFREDLYYRLGTVPIVVPALRERPEDIPLLFRKFASDVATQYRMPAVTLDDGARQLLTGYYWRGNIRQLKNVAEQISAIEQSRVVTAEILGRYLPEQHAGASIMAGAVPSGDAMSSERELLYKVLFDMRADINELKRMMGELMQGAGVHRAEPAADIKALLPSAVSSPASPVVTAPAAVASGTAYAVPPVFAESEDVTDEPVRELTKADVQREQIVRALRRNNGRRREAARELFMSERTLYRKIKELGIEEN